MDRDELGAWLRLLLTPGVGPGTARRLLSHYGLPQNLFESPSADWKAWVTPTQARALSQLPERWQDQVNATWQWLHPTDPEAEPGRTLIPLGDPRYPTSLLETEDPPLLLYVTGPRAWLQTATAADLFPTHASLAVVGSRNPTAQGADNARQFAHTLQSAGWTIVSGLALGVDAAAHEGALAAPADPRPATIAVVGTGLDRVYPRSHLALAHRIAAHGLLVSEYPLGTPPLAGNFPKRNRIISGLTRGTLVVEAALASGSLITARMAAEQGREVFAIPGSIHSPQSRGCHALIRQGAKLVESAQDILEELTPWAAPITSTTHQPPAAQDAEAATPTSTDADDNPAHSPDARSIVRALGFDPQGLDALVARTGLDAGRLQAALLELELDGDVARLPGGLFQRIHRG